MKYFSDEIARPANPAGRVQHQFWLQQWREIEEMLVERGAHDTRITALEYRVERRSLYNYSSSARSLQ
jgi:hypothetical protein